MVWLNWRHRFEWHRCEKLHCKKKKERERKKAQLVSQLNDNAWAPLFTFLMFAEVFSLRIYILTRRRLVMHLNIFPFVLEDHFLIHSCSDTYISYSGPYVNPLKQGGNCGTTCPIGIVVNRTVKSVCFYSPVKLTP